MDRPVKINRYKRVNLKKKVIASFVITSLITQPLIPALAQVHYGYMDDIDHMGGNFSRSRFYTSLKIGDNQFFTTKQGSQSEYVLRDDLKPYWYLNDYDTSYFYQQMHASNLVSESMPRRLGDKFLETELIRKQLVFLINRSFFEGFTSEADQNKYFYDNAIQFAKETGIAFGEKIDPNIPITQNMIWPEMQILSSGKRFLAPVVYLTKETILQQRIKGLTVTVGGNLNIQKYENIEFEDATLSAMKGALITAKSDISLTKSSFDSKGDVVMKAGGLLQNLSSQISGKDITFIADEMEHQTLFMKVPIQGTGYSEVAAPLASIEALGNLTVQTSKDFTMRGATIDANTDITFDIGGQSTILSLELLDQWRYPNTKTNSRHHQSSSISSGGDFNFTAQSLWLQDGHIDSQGNANINVETSILMLSSYNEENTHSEEGKWQEDKRNRHANVSSIRAQKGLQLLAKNNIRIVGGQIQAVEENVDLLAGLGITILNDANFDSYQFHNEGTNSGFFGGHEYTEDEKKKTKEIVSALIQSGKDVKLRTVYGDITIQSSEFIPSGSTHASATNGSINLKGDLREFEYRNLSSAEGDLYDTQWDSGNIDKTVQYNKFGGAGLILPTGQKISIDYGCSTSKCTSEEVLKYFSEASHYRWLQDALKNENVSWNKIKEVHNNWNTVETQLSAEFSALIAIAVTLATAGTGASASLAVSIGATKGTLAATALASVITAASVTAAAALANGDNPFEAISSDEFLKKAIVSALTAGVMHGLNKMFDIGDAATEGLDTAKDTASSAKNQLIESFSDFADPDKIITQVSYTAAESVARATISSFIYQKDWGEEVLGSLKFAAIGVLGKAAAHDIASSAKAIGSSSGEGLQTAYKYIAHASLGCAIGASTSNEKGCADGAIGGAVGEFVGNMINEYTQDNYMDPEDYASQEEFMDEMLRLKEQGIHLSKFAAALTAFASGFNPEIAGRTAENASRNNALHLLLLAASVAWTIHDLNERIEELSHDTEFKQAIQDKNYTYIAQKLAEAGVMAALEGLVGKFIKPAKLIKKAFEKLGYDDFGRELAHQMSHNIDLVFAKQAQSRKGVQATPSKRSNKSPNSSDNENSCFVGTTLVHVQTGKQTLSKIRLGDFVYAPIHVH